MKTVKTCPTCGAKVPWNRSKYCSTICGEVARTGLDFNALVRRDSLHIDTSRDRRRDDSALDNPNQPLGD